MNKKPNFPKNNSKGDELIEKVDSIFCFSVFYVRELHTRKCRKNK